MIIKTAYLSNHDHDWRVFLILSDGSVSIAVQSSGGIFAKLEVEAHTFFASTEAVASTRDTQIKVTSLTFRPQYKCGKKRRPKGRNFRDKDRIDPVLLIRRTHSIIGPKHVGRVRRAMNKVIKELGLR